MVATVRVKCAPNSSQFAAKLSSLRGLHHQQSLIHRLLSGLVYQVKQRNGKWNPPPTYTQSFCFNYSEGNLSDASVVSQWPPLVKGCVQHHWYTDWVTFFPCDVLG